MARQAGTSRVKDQRKQQLIQATMDSIAKRGLTETTITHISKGANLSRGIVNFYFDSKENMMRDVLAYLLGEYQATWQGALNKADAADEARLEALIRAQFDRRVCSSKRLNVLSAFWGHAASHEPYRQQFEAADSAVIDALASCLARNDAQTFATQLFAMIRGYWLRFMLAPKANDRDKLAEDVLTFALDKRQGLKVVSENRAFANRSAMRKPPAPRAKQSAQMDIEDLFANG